jgi:hypothetical protein
MRAANACPAKGSARAVSTPAITASSSCRIGTGRDYAIKISSSDGVPIFILTRHDPADLRQWPLVTYVNDVTSAMTQAKEAAGDKNCHPGALRLRAPSIRGLAAEQIELQCTRILEGEGDVTHLHYRLQR